MKRNRPKSKPTAILTGDWHLMETAPICRTDDILEAVARKIGFIKDIQKEHGGIPIWHSGDLFDHWKPSPYLITWTMKHLPQPFFTVLGNHDVPQHNIDMVGKTGVGTLAESGHLHILPGSHWGQTPAEPTILHMDEEGVADAAIFHTMTWKGKSPWPGCMDPNVEKLMDMIPDADLILTGHNHKAFTHEKDGRLLVNPGSILRLSADQIDFKPRVYLWYADSNTVEAVHLPIDDVVTREHIELKAEKDERIQKFIDNLDTDWRPEISLEENLRKAFQENKTPSVIQENIWKALEVEG